MALRLIDLLDTVFDPGSLRAWEIPLVTDRPGPDSYAAELAAARQRTGRGESAWVGEALLRGRRVAVVAGDAEFLGGSLGVAAAELITTGIERATEESLPVIAFPIGGGTRMQEGTLAFLQMVKITGAVMAHKAANLPYLVYLRNPTMGGVFASWGSLGQVAIAEPGALVGFLGPRVYRALYGQDFPAGVQLAENLAERGIIDAVLPVEELASALDGILEVCLARREHGLTSDALPALRPLDTPDISGVDAWRSVQQTRRPDRPGIRELLAHATTATMLNGTGDGESHPGSVLALAMIGQAPCVVLGQDRHAQSIENPLDPAALREARRGLRLAAELRLPLVTVIDTPGAALSKEAEERGLASEIARTLSELLTLPTPTVSVLLGQGAGGIALALVPADAVLACQDAWLAPLPPEGASAITHRTTDRAAEMARLQGVSSTDLLKIGIVDSIIATPDEPGRQPQAFIEAVSAATEAALLSVMARPRQERRAARVARYRKLGLS